MEAPASKPGFLDSRRVVATLRRRLLYEHNRLSADIHLTSDNTGQVRSLLEVLCLQIYAQQTALMLKDIESQVETTEVLTTLVSKLESSESIQWNSGNYRAAEAVTRTIDVIKASMRELG